VEPSKFRIFLCIVFTELGHFHFLLTEWHDGVVIDKKVYCNRKTGLPTCCLYEKKADLAPKKARKSQIAVLRHIHINKRITKHKIDSSEILI